MGEDADINQLKEKILQTRINSGFIKYYNKISKKCSIKTFFLTGRKKANFLEETKKQLVPLNPQNDQIIYYPDSYLYTKSKYKYFKIFNILKIAVENKDYDKITIYDDLDGYFPRLSTLGADLYFNNYIPRLFIRHVKNYEHFWWVQLKKLLRKEKRKKEIKNERD